MKSVNRRCSHCRKKVPASGAVIGGLRAFCSYEHLIAYARSEKGAVVRSQAERADTRERKQKLKTKSDYMKEAQAAFNAYIRFRDRKQGCISCGSHPEQRYGGAFDAGHYRSRGAAGHLRFDLRNCHAQCKKCNRQLSGNVTEYRVGLLQKIGEKAVNKLESDNSQRKFSIEYLKRVKKVFARKLLIRKRIVGE